MPIYEFYCQNCNTIYNFFSKTVNTEKIPICPTCKTIELKRQMSIFAKISRIRSSGSDDDSPQVDAAEVEKVMAMMASKLDEINQEDPRKAANLLRQISDVTGMNLTPKMEEALKRIERGEDPEKVEEQMGDLFNGDDYTSLFGERLKKSMKKNVPQVDETLYEL